MSYDFALSCDCCKTTLGDWNYTFNIAPMIVGALESIPPGEHWLDRLDGKPGPEGAAFLNDLISRLEADPARFEDMNPPNGWGSYAGLLLLLREMRDRVPECPTTWWASG